MPDIVLKDRNGNDITFPGINSIKVKTTNGGTQEFLNGEMVEKTVAPDFSGGNVEVAAEDGTFITKVTVEKPETLLPENVRNGVEVAGVTGEFIGDTEEVTVELALADGNQTVSPSADGKVISGVTITKPANLVPENIAKDVEIAGVVGSAVTETEEATVELDFSNGAMEVTPTEDKTLSKVNIPVPETLIPENIAEGVDIAGIVGTMAAGGGNVRVDYGTVKVPTSGFDSTITHNLGVVPDIVLFYTTYSSRITTSGRVILAFGISEAFSQICPITQQFRIAYNNGVFVTFAELPIEVTASSATIWRATETKFEIYHAPIEGNTYQWLAIGGLT